MKTLNMAVAAVADQNGMAWLADIATAIGMAKADVAQIARARGMRLERCDLPREFRQAKASEVALLGGLDVVHYISVPGA